MASTSQPQTEPAPPHPFLNNRKPLNIIIVGGSLSALFTAIPLKRLGHNTTLLESTPATTREGTAAGIGLASHVKSFFDTHDRLNHIPFGIRNAVVQVLDKELGVAREIPIDQLMTTWDATYYRLKANFDGEASVWCPDPPPLEEGEGRGVIEGGKKVVRVEEVEGGMRVVARDVRTGEEVVYEGDVVVAADGANSTVRRQLFPEVDKDVPGFLIWRGTVPTAALSQELLEKIEGKTMIYPMRNSYVIFYTIPSPPAPNTPPSRSINFAWYDWPPTPDSIPTILTDIHAHTHATTLPKGTMRPEIWSAQLARAHRAFHPLLLEIPLKLASPFVSLISSVVAPRATACGGRLFFVGDALVQVQPNTGQGVNLAARAAMGLGEVFAGRRAVGSWEEEVLEMARGERERSRSFPRRWLYSDETAG